MNHPIVMSALKEMPVFLTLCCKCALGRGTLGGGSEACQGSLLPLLPPSSFLMPQSSSQTAAGSTPRLQALCASMLSVVLAACSSCWQGCHLLQLQYQEEERGLCFQITSSWRELFNPGKTCLSLFVNTGMTTRGKQAKMLLRELRLLGHQDRKSVII